MSPKQFKSRTLYILTPLVFILCTFTFTIMLPGCGSDDGSGPIGGCNESHWSTYVENELQEFTDALTAYSNEQTTANCDIFKSKAHNYIDALETIEDCVLIAQKAEYKQAIDDLRADIDDIEC